MSELSEILNQIREELRELRLFYKELAERRSGSEEFSRKHCFQVVIMEGRAGES